METSGSQSGCSVKPARGYGRSFLISFLIHMLLFLAIWIISPALGNQGGEPSAVFCFLADESSVAATSTHDQVQTASREERISENRQPIESKLPTNSDQPLPDVLENPVELRTPDQEITMEQQVENNQEEFKSQLSRAESHLKSAFPSKVSTARSSPPASSELHTGSARSLNTASGSAGHEIDAIHLPPVAVWKPAPEYPERARRLGREGIVVLTALISSNGDVKEVNLKNSSGNRLLDMSAVNTVGKHWRFQAAQSGHRPVESLVEIPIHFRLQ